jgi:hypothetical protein
MLASTKETGFRGVDLLLTTEWPAKYVGVSCAKLPATSWLSVVVRATAVCCRASRLGCAHLSRFSVRPAPWYDLVCVLVVATMP